MKKRTKHKTKKPKEIKVFVAVVMLPNKWVSARTEGDWACFVGDSKTAITQKALTTAQKWKRVNNQPYWVMVGELFEAATARVIEPEVSFKKVHWVD